LSLFVVFVPNRLWRTEERVSFRKGVSRLFWGIVRLPVVVVGGLLRTSSECDSETMRLRVLLESLLGITDEKAYDEFCEHLPLSITSLDGTPISLAMLRKEPIRGRIREPYQQFATAWDEKRPERR
jgi:hypothetical protein